MKPVLTLMMSASLGVMATSCVMYKEPPPPRSIEYGTFSCDGSYQFVAQFEEEANRVAVTFDRGRTRMLYKNPSGLYVDGTYALQGSETTPITIYEDGIPIMRNCVPVTTQKQYYRKEEKFRVFDVNRDLEGPGG